MKVFPQDKLNHYFYGSMVAMVVSVVLMQFGVLIASLASVVVAMVVGMVKEFMDKRTGGVVDRKDAIWTACGAVPVVVPQLASLAW